MNEREEHIIDAAMRLFVRYGVKRTGMNDIAEEAAISRQTLYNSFSNKDEVLQGTIRLLADRVIADIKEGIQHSDDLGERLEIIFKHVTIEHFDLMHASPNAEEIIAGFNASSQAELEAGAQRNISIISEVLEPYAKQIAKSGMDVRQLADFIQRSTNAAKYSASDRKHLLELLATLKIAVLKITASD